MRGCGVKNWEKVKVEGGDLLKRVRELVHEGNVRRVVIKQGTRTLAEFPVTVGVVGAVAAPMLAALGAAAALLADCTIEVERERPGPAKSRSTPVAARSRKRKG